MKMNDVTQKPL